jgi:hypothetical protein
MRTTKVLMTADTVGGVWTYALDLSRTLAPYGCEITLATMGGRLSATEARTAAGIRNLHLHESSFRLEWMDEPWNDVTDAGGWLLELAHTVQPNIVHLNNFAHGALPWPAPVLIVGHSCVLSWWQAVKGEPAPAQWERYAAVVRRGIEAADLLIAPTQAIHTGRSPGLFRRGTKEPLILAVGRLWDEAKNVQVLDQAAGAVRWPVYVAGEEHHPSGGQQHFANVTPLGKLAAPELSSWFARAAIYALPARYEPFGLSVLEAALSGCALVLGDIPSLREVWGNAALYVAPDDPLEIAAALVKLSTDDQLRTRLAHAAYLRGQQYTLSAMGVGYWQAYQTLLVDAALPTRAAVHKQPAVSFWPPAAYQTSTQLGR